MVLEIGDEIQKAIGDAIVKAFAGRLADSYDSPLKKIADKIVAQNEDALVKTVSDQFALAISTDEFRCAARDHLVHQLARSLMSKLESHVDKAANVIKSNPATKAQMIVAIERIVKETLAGA